MAEESETEQDQDLKEKVDSSAKPSTDDPLDIKKNAKGIGALLAVCVILLLVVQYMPTAADNFSGWVAEKFGIEKSEEQEAEPEKEAVAEKADAKTDEKKTEPAEKTPPKEEPKPEPETTTEPEVVVTNPRNAYVRKSLLEQLGGADKVTIRHVAFSKDESRMVAQIIFLETNKKEEVIFELDEFDRYIPKAGSAIGEDIQIWAQE